MTNGVFGGDWLVGVFAGVCWCLLARLHLWWIKGVVGVMGLSLWGWILIFGLGVVLTGGRLCLILVGGSEWFVEVGAQD